MTIKQNSSIEYALDNEGSEYLSSSEFTQDSLPKGWRVARLGDVYKFTKKPKDLRYSIFEQIPFVPMDLIPIGHVSFDQFVLKANDELSSGTYFEPGDILIAKITPSFENGKQGIIESLPTPFGIASTEVIPIKEIEGISDKYYLFYYLLRQAIRTELAGKMEGSTGRQRLNITTLANLALPFPPLSQQHAIAKVLLTLQATIQARREEVNLERERKAALMEYLFTHGTCGEAIKQTVIGVIPESWEVVRLGELCVNNLGFIQTGPFGSQLHASDYRDQGVPVINPTHLGINTIVEDSIPLICEEDAERLSKHYLREGDVLISRRGDFSRYAYITSRQGGWLCGTGCLLIRITNPRVDNQFFAISIGMEFIQNYLESNATGTIMPNLTDLALRN